MEQEQLSLDAENLTRRTAKRHQAKHLDGYEKTSQTVKDRNESRLYSPKHASWGEAEVSISKRRYQIGIGYKLPAFSFLRVKQ